jgi:hypothetical protein
MKQKYSELEKVLKQIATARISTKQNIAKLKKQREDYTEEHAADFIDPKIREVKAGLTALQEVAYEKVVKLIGELNDLAVAKSDKLDLNNPAWQNTLKLIELSGAGISTETVLQINAQFANDQAALCVLRDVYKAKGVVYDGGLDKQIYDPVSSFDHLGEWAVHSLLQEGSLNGFALAISKVASMEGIAFPKMVDEVGSDNAMRASAGLPVE